MNYLIYKPKYDVIVIDPPWRVKKIVRKVRPKQTSELDYPTMSLAEIAGMKICELAADNCVLFLWTTHAYLPMCFDLLKKWEFKYQRTLTWDKQNGMCLFGFHHRSEFVVMGYRGKIPIYPCRKAVPTVFQGKSEKHSAKPDCFYDMISTFGNRRIDIFARKNRDGWDVFGNEVNGGLPNELVI